MDDRLFTLRSTNPGVMHACGHDGHTAILLGLARFLREHGDFSGQVKLLGRAALSLLRAQ